MSSTTNTTDLRGACVAPFYDQDKFPATGGYITGRFCARVPALNNASCCLPCPVTDWTYEANFESTSEIANWINVASFIFCLFLLLSYAFLPPKYTHRHYLSVCTTVSVLFMALAFMIPLGTPVEMCYNEITPNDMRTSGPCAASGAFLLFGGWSVVVWVFLRSLSLHLQICWEITLGNTFLWSSMAVGWGTPVIILSIVLPLTGVSYRFGNVCHVNHRLALKDFWGPLLVFAAMAMVLQFITMAYCIHVFVKGFSNDKTTSVSTGRPATATGSIAAATAKETYRRVKRLIKLHWRGAMIVLVIIAEVAFFAAVFVSMDNSSQMSDATLEEAMPWLICLVYHPDDKDQCVSKVGKLVQPESVVLPVLIVLGLSGFWCLLFFGRWSMLRGWAALFKRSCRKNNEFVSADARRFSGDPRNVSSAAMAPTDAYSNMPNGEYATHQTGPSPSTGHSSPEFESKDHFDYNGQTRVYVTPVTSYSVPRPPSAFGNNSTDWALKASLRSENGSPSPPPLPHFRSKE